MLPSQSLCRADSWWSLQLLKILSALCWGAAATPIAHDFYIFRLFCECWLSFEAKSKTKGHRVYPWAFTALHTARTIIQLKWNPTLTIQNTSVELVESNWHFHKLLHFLPIAIRNSKRCNIISHLWQERKIREISFKLIPFQLKFQMVSNFSHQSMWKCKWHFHSEFIFQNILSSSVSGPLPGF